MNELDIAAIKHRSIKGVVSLTSRTLFIQIISQAVTFLLTVYLTPADYGVFFLVSGVMVFFSYFSDIGLAAALIQKKEAITATDLSTTFTIQQGLVLVLVITGLLLTPVVGDTYHLNADGRMLYTALIIAFFLSSLKTIPSILLERELRFNKLVIPEIVETIFFNSTVLVLAISGAGVASFTYAVLARGISGLVTMYSIAPWWPRIGIDREAAQKLLSFGLPFQANSLLALVKDNLLILYLGAILSKDALGFIGVAQKWAMTPLRLIMDNLIRITFPSFSRLAESPTYLSRALERTLFSVTIVIFPALTGMVIMMPHFMRIFPNYQKWEPALLSFLFFAINAVLSSISTPLTNILNAIGKIRVTLSLMIFWTVATWVLTPLLVATMGYDGVGLASALIASSVIGVVYLVKRYIDFRVLPAIVPSGVAAGIMGTVLWFISPILIHDFVSFFLIFILGAGIYSGVIFLLARDRIIADIQMIRMSMRK